MAPPAFGATAPQESWSRGRGAQGSLHLAHATLSAWNHATSCMGFSFAHVTVVAVQLPQIKWQSLEHSAAYLKFTSSIQI
jgi:hypothetical protein